MGDVYLNKYRYIFVIELEKNVMLKFINNNGLNAVLPPPPPILFEFGFRPSYFKTRNFTPSVLRFS